MVTSKEKYKQSVLQNEWDYTHENRLVEPLLDLQHLELHPEKTGLLEFGRYATERRQRRGDGRPETFNFLGFSAKPTNIVVRPQ